LSFSAFASIAAHAGRDFAVISHAVAEYCDFQNRAAELKISAASHIGQRRVTCTLLLKVTFVLYPLVAPV
jgi:hypothetical protein